MGIVKTIDIDTMPAGREIDALVAEKVMGIVILGEARCAAPEGDWMVLSGLDDLDDTYGVTRSVYLDMCHCENLDRGDQELAKENPHLVDTICQNRKERQVFGHDVICLGVVSEYSNFMEPAWQVVEKVCKDTYAVFEIRGTRGHLATFRLPPSDRSEDIQGDVRASSGLNAAPLAICRAAWKAKQFAREVKRKELDFGEGD